MASSPIPTSLESRKWLYLTGLMLALIPWPGTAQTVASTLKLEVVSGLPIVGGVFVDGHGPYRFLLDTAGQVNEIDSGLARKIGLTATFQRQVQAPTGLSRIAGTTVDNVMLGPMDASAEDFLFVSSATFRGLPIHGVLGQAFLRRYDYTLDYRHHTIAFGVSPPKGERIAFQLAHQCMVVPTNLGGLLLDSGSSTLFLFRPGPELVTMAVLTSVGEAAVSVASAPALRVAGKEYRRESAAYQPLANPPAAGLLPATLFRAIYVSNSEGYVVFDPQ